VTKYLGPPSENRWPDFLKTVESPQGLQLDIFYPEYGLQSKYKENNTKNISNSFTKEIPIILSNSKSGINSRKNYVKKIGSF